MRGVARGWGEGAWLEEGVSQISHWKASCYMKCLVSFPDPRGTVLIIACAWY